MILLLSTSLFGCIEKTSEGSVVEPEGNAEDTSSETITEEDDDSGESSIDSGEMMADSGEEPADSGETTADSGEPALNETIEGRWLIEVVPNTPANTMYEFVDGLRYTYYCAVEPCNDDYWNGLDTLDAIPTTNPYTVDDDTLTVDLHYGNELVTTLTFECDGAKVWFNSAGYYMQRLGSDLDDCAR